MLQLGIILFRRSETGGAAARLWDPNLKNSGFAASHVTRCQLRTTTHASRAAQEEDTDPVCQRRQFCFRHRVATMQKLLAFAGLVVTASALSAYHSQRTHSKEAASYRAQASQLRKEAAILETELIKERKALEALRELENPKPAETTPQKPVLVAKAGAVEVRWALDDAGALKAKVAAGGATLDLDGSWRASDRTVLLAASGVLGVRVACEAPMMAAEGVRAARERRRTCERALARAEQAAPEVVRHSTARRRRRAGGRLGATPARRRARRRRPARGAPRRLRRRRAGRRARWDAAVRPSTARRSP